MKVREAAEAGGLGLLLGIVMAFVLENGNLSYFLVFIPALQAVGIGIYQTIPCNFLEQFYQNFAKMFLQLLGIKFEILPITIWYQLSIQARKSGIVNACPSGSQVAK